MHELNRSEFKSRMHVLPILTLTGTNQTATHYIDPVVQVQIIADSTYLQLMFI